jgi:branched-chain amino acid transport system substrate-binding protein
MKRSLWACGAVAVVLVLAACGSSSSKSSGSSPGSSGTKTAAATTKAPIQVLSIGDTSGATKIYGSLHYAGLLAAAAYLNAHGGINGRKIVITHLDSGGITANSVSLAIKALAGSPGKYAFVDAGVEGTEDDALIPIMKKYNQFAITLDDAGDCSHVSNCPTEFVVKGNPGDPEHAAADFFKSKGLKKVGILEESIAFTQGETPGIIAALKADGITPTVVTFPATATDVTPEMQSLKSQGVQGVYAEALGPPAGYALAARAKLSWNTAPVVFDVAASSLDLTKLAPAAEVKNAYLNVYNCQNGAAPLSAGMTAMLANIPSQYNATASGQACDITGNGWDGMLEFADAAKQAGSTSGPALVKAMLNLTPANQSDPLYITSKKKCYSTSNHDDACEVPGDFTVIPVGPVSKEQDHPL